MGLLELRTIRRGYLAGGEAFLGLLQGLLRLSQTTAEGQRIALDEVMEEVKYLRDAQALSTRFGQFDQRFCPITHQRESPDSQCLQPRLDQRVPRVITPLLCHLFE